jgi:iron complex outermembrane recepter protein
LTAGKKATPVRGDLVPTDALLRLLKGSGLTYARAADGTIAIQAIRGNGPVQASAGESGLETDLTARRDIEEVIVTAQKREERLIDTPQSVSVLSSDYLANLGASQFRDYANMVPGLGFETAGAGFTQLIVRGVTAGLNVGPTVGIYVDDVPYGGSSNFTGSGHYTLDVGLFDLDHLEVLRGPQGTLYGASTMGGLLKYVTRAPDITQFSAEVLTGGSATDHGGAGYNVAAVLNAPILANKAAIRLDGYETHDGGYIDNIALNRKDADRSDIYGGRADLLFAPSDALSIRLTGVAQNIARDGEPSADYTFKGAPIYGEYEQSRKIPEPFDLHFRLGSGTIEYRLPSATITSISSYQSSNLDLAEDLSPGYVPIANLFGGPYGAVGYAQLVSTDKFTQELRLASTGARALEWLVGGFYTNEKSTNHQNFILLNTAGAMAPNNLYIFDAPSRFEEYAAFGDLTWHLSSTFDVTGGVRYARNNQRYEQSGEGSRLVPSHAPTTSTSDVFTYLANARYHLSDNATAYIRYATGYRPGGPNFVTLDATTGLPTGPATFDPDRLKSYEVGYKGESANRRYGIDIAAYFIDWSNIQVSVTKGGFAAIANAAGGARVTGAELMLSARPLDALKIQGAFAYQHAYMRQADPNLGATLGQQLPDVPRYTAALDGDYVLPWGSANPTVGATVRYVDSRLASWDLSKARPQYNLPSYTALDLRAGATISSVNLQLYVRNVTNEYAQLSAYTWQGVARPAIMQPRTVGVTASVHF